MSDALLNVRIHFLGYKEYDDELIAIGSDRYRRMTERELSKALRLQKRHIRTVEQLELDSERLDQPWKEQLVQVPGKPEIAQLVEEDEEVEENGLRDFDEDDDDDGTWSYVRSP